MNVYKVPHLLFPKKQKKQKTKNKNKNTKPLTERRFCIYSYK